MSNNNALVEITLARQITAQLSNTRFAGRAELLRLMPRDDTALRALEMSPRDREIAALRGELSAAVIKALAGGGEIKIALERREQRAAARKRGHDVLATREPGNVLRRATLRAFRTDLAQMDLREARHGHDLHVEYGERASASSHQHTAWPREVGLPASYKYPVQLSEHRYVVAADYLRGPRRAGKWLYLSATLRVAQGRGTSLRVERRSTAGKWSEV